MALKSLQNFLFTAIQRQLSFPKKTTLQCYFYVLMYFQAVQACKYCTIRWEIVQVLSRLTKSAHVYHSNTVIENTKNGNF